MYLAELLIDKGYDVFGLVRARGNMREETLAASFLASGGSAVT